MKKDNTKQKIFFGVILSLFAFYLADRVTSYWLSLKTDDIVDKINLLQTEFLQKLNENPMYIDKSKDCLKAGGIAVLAIALAMLYNLVGNKNYRPNEEHGSAKWANPNDIKKYMDKDPFKNVIFTATEGMSMDGHKTRRNLNTLVVGGSGTGKTRFVVKPGILQMNSSYVAIDPKGTLLPEVGNALKENDFEMKVFNTINFEKSMHYNPFVYIKKEKDILKFANTLILNTKGDGEKDDFFVKAERLFYNAIIGYMIENLDEEERTFENMIRFVDESQVKESDEDYISGVDQLFLDLEEEKGSRNFAVRQYKKFKLAAGKTMKSVLISCAARLGPFDIQEVLDITSHDEMELDTLGDRKQALFIIIDDTDDTFNFLVTIMYTQLFNQLCNKADDVYGGQLPVHVRMYMDEFANTGRVPNFEKLIATVRSRNISLVPILQNEAQLEALYEKSSKTIKGNCDTLLFLGSGEEETQENISKKIGDETVHIKNTSESKGQNGSWSQSEQALQRKLMTSDEVGLLTTDECILFVRGERPFKSRKYPLEKHPNYKLTADADKKLTYDIVKELDEIRYEVKIPEKKSEQAKVIKMTITEADLEQFDYDKAMELAKEREKANKIDEIIETEDNSDDEIKIPKKGAKVISLEVTEDELEEYDYDKSMKKDLAKEVTTEQKNAIDEYPKEETAKEESNDEVKSDTDFTEEIQDEFEEANEELEEEPDFSEFDSETEEEPNFDEFNEELEEEPDFSEFDSEIEEEPNFDGFDDINLAESGTIENFGEISSENI